MTSRNGTMNAFDRTKSEPAVGLVGHTLVGMFSDEVDRTLPGQEHGVDADALVPVLIDVFASRASC